MVMAGALYKNKIPDHVGACRGTFSKIRMEILLINVPPTISGGPPAPSEPPPGILGGLRPPNPPGKAPPVGGFRQIAKTGKAL